MKQILQSFKTGQTELSDVPVPMISKGKLLIQTTHSLVSIGTERMLVEFGKSNLISKARQQPERVKQVLDKIRTEGLVSTLEAVFSKLEQPLPLGYCNVGRVIAVGEDVPEFVICDRVASNGPHAEYVNVSQNLVAKIPDNVSDEEATFTVVGSIGLQGIRLCNPTIGETIVVIGLGLIGLLASQLLLSNGCRVIGFDYDEHKVDLAKNKGVKAFLVSKETEPVRKVKSLTNDIGSDGVLITASSKSNDVISQSAEMCRKKGRIVLVGVVGLDINRTQFYEKELTFQVSCSYGPGRYDEDYEQKGIDYPLPYVRWTEKRNFETILNLIGDKKLDVNPLISEIVPIEEYEKIYGNIDKTKSIATIFSYPEEARHVTSVKVTSRDFSLSKCIIGIIGTGNYTQMILLPALDKLKAKIKVLANLEGVSSTALARKYKIPVSTTDYKTILSDPEINTVFVITRHDQHASLVKEILKTGKNVFVEKPLALNQNELDEIIQTYKGSNNTLTVGFNRRFSPFTQKIKRLLGGSGTPLNMIANVNAGYISPENWVHDMDVGGGRIIGEACHFIDLFGYFTGSYVRKVCMSALGTNPKENSDNAILVLQYADGSQGVINYFSNGNKSYSKERIEIYSEGKTLILDNFRYLRGYGIKGFKRLSSKQDKGHLNQFKELIERTGKGGESLIPFELLVNTTKTSFSAIESLKSGKWIEIK